MRREKRSVVIKARITPALQEQLELHLSADVIPLSAYLFKLVAEDMERKKPIVNPYIGLRKVKVGR